MPARVLTGWLGVAIIAITFHNAGTFFHTRPIPSVLVSTVLNSCWVGLSLIVVLLGYWATDGLIRTDEPRGRRIGPFYRRVLLSTVPIYYLTILVAFLVVPRLIDGGAWSDSVARDQIWYWTLTRNWAPDPGVQISGFQHIWAVAAAWPILLVWPFVVLYAGVRGVAALIVFSLAWRVMAFSGGAAAPQVYHTTIGWIDTLGFGSLAAFALHDPRWVQAARRVGRCAFGVCSLGLAAVAIGTRGFSAGNRIVVEFGAVLAGIWFAALLIGSVTERGRVAETVRSALSARWLQQVGRYAFAIYVLHFPLHLALTRLIPDPVASPVVEIVFRMGYDTVVLAASTAVAVALWGLLSAGGHRLSARLRPAR